MRETDRKINALTGGSRESSNNVRKTLKKQISGIRESTRYLRKTLKKQEKRSRSRISSPANGENS
jgi:hypothetical protein